MKSKVSPVFKVCYKNSTLAYYTQAWRCAACVRLLIESGDISDLTKLKVFRYSLSKSSDILLICSDITSSIINIVNNVSKRV